MPPENEGEESRGREGEKQLPSARLHDSTTSRLNEKGVNDAT